MRTGQSFVHSGRPVLSYAGMTVDYALAWFSSALKDAHRISLNYRFGSSRAEPCSCQQGGQVVE